MQPQAGQFCPSCKRYNEPGAIFCVYCGASLEEGNFQPVTTSRFGVPEASESGLAIAPHPFQRTIPESGLAFFFLEDALPFEICTEDEFLLGRKVDDAPEYMVDLAIYDGFGHGVSRRHARIRRVGGEYEIIDLESTNGTWVDEYRIPPNKPYPLKSGAVVRLGRMRLYVAYKEPSR